MSQWLQSAKASVSAGSSVINFTDNKDFSSIRAGDAVMLNGQIWQCLSGSRPDSAGKSSITLAAPWPYTGASNVNAFVFRTTHDLLRLTSDARKLTDITKALLAAQEDILRGTTPTINVPIGVNSSTGDTEEIEVTPWQYIINIVNSSLGNISAIGAMSQAQFEAIRAQNNDRFAASGFVHFGKHRNVIGSPSTGTPVNQGLWAYYLDSSSGNSFRLGIADGVSNTEGSSKLQQPILNIAGVTFELSALNVNSNKQNNIKFPLAPDGKTTYNKSTGVRVNHSTVTAAFNAAGADPTNVEVVTDRVDMWGFETYLEEISVANPYVYPNGLIQSQATTMDGIATSASARPVTYYAVFDGDVVSKGKGLNYYALTDAQKKKVLANPKNNMHFLDDGRLVQWRLRQRTIAGVGNGDWGSISSVSGVGITKGVVALTAQGQKDFREPFVLTTSGVDTYRATNTSYNNSPQIGAYTVVSSSVGTAVNNECYFLVCGTVNRLNKGAYHPSFNPSGASAHAWLTNPLGSVTWYNATVARYPSSVSDCFNTFANGGVKTNDVATGTILGAYTQSRPDGRFYDAIYADGQGGVCRDMRYSANGVDLVDFAEVDRKVKNGTYRGFERLAFSKAGFTVKLTPTFSGGRTLIYIDNSLDFFGGTPSSSAVGAFILNATGRYLVEIYSSNATGNYVYINSVHGNVTTQFLVNSQVLLERPSVTSVGGSFLQTDVIGDHANILATPQLTNGWQGSWIPSIPDGVKDEFSLTRKYVGSGSDIIRTYTTNNGSSWVSGGIVLTDPIKNQSTFTNMPVSQVALYQYKASSNQTEPTVNAVVYGGKSGVGSVWEYAGFYPQAWGNGLVESLLGKIGISADTSLFAGDLPLVYSLLRLTGEQDTSSNRLALHSPVNLAAPTNNSPAVKVLNYNVNINQQAIPHYAYTELKHNGTNWGDDGKVTIVDNKSTKTDLNGNTVLVGTAKLKEPIGWIKNKV
jgi:hypothetical protein